MSQQPRSRPTAPEAAEATQATVAAAPALSNGPTIFLLILVVGMMAFIAWWAFFGEGARAKANATLPPPPRLDAVPVRPKTSPKPVPAATPAPDAAVTASSARAAAPSETAPVISEVPAPATERQKNDKSGATVKDAD